MSHAIIHVAADGSAGSRRAFSWALHEAAFRRCAVELVSAYQPGEDGSPDAARTSGETALHLTMDDVLDGRADVPAVSWSVVEGEPADVLVRESRGSALLAMGSHSVEGLMHSLLGWVADTCARMADCPLVIIPPAGRAATNPAQITTSEPFAQETR